MSNTDWMWCYENPHKAASEIDKLTAEVYELKQRLFCAKENAKVVLDVVHSTYQKQIESLCAEIGKTA